MVNGQQGGDNLHLIIAGWEAGAGIIFFHLQRFEQQSVQLQQYAD